MADQLFEIRTDDRDHQRAMRKMQKDLDAANARYVKIAQSVARGTREQKKSFEATNQQRGAVSALVTRVGGLAAGYLSVRSAINLINQELRLSVELTKRAGQAQVTAAQAERQFLANLAGVAPAARTKALRQIARISAETGVDQARLFVPTGEAFSASGNLQAALDAVRVGAIVNPQDPGGLASGLLDVAKVTGTTDAQQNIGFVAAALQQSRVTTPRAFAQNVVPGAANVAGFGDTDVFAVSLVNALTKRLVDPEGSLSATAASRFASVVAGQVPEATSTEARLAILQQDPRRATSVLEGIEQGKTKQALAELFDPTSMVAKDLREGAAVLANIPDRAAAGQAFLSGLQDTPLQRVEAAKRAVEAGAESFRLADAQRGLAGVFAEKSDELTELLDRSATGNLFRSVVSGPIQRGLGVDQAEIEEEAIRNRVRQLQATQASAQRGGRFAQEPLTASQQAQLEALERILDTLDRARNEQKVSLDALIGATDKAVRNGASRTLDQNVRD